MKEFKYKINGNTYNVAINNVNDNLAEVEVNGTKYNVELEAAPKPEVKPVVHEVHKPAAPANPAPKPAARKSGIKSPLPGVILDIKVQVGDAVKKGQTLLILEAMKMENNIDADRGGVVKEILVQQGATVMEGDNLIIIE